MSGLLSGTLLASLCCLVAASIASPGNASVLFDPSRTDWRHHAHVATRFTSNILVRNKARNVACAPFEAKRCSHVSLATRITKLRQIFNQSVHEVDARMMCIYIRPRISKVKCLVGSFLANQFNKWGPDCWCVLGAIDIFVQHGVGSHLVDHPYLTRWTFASIVNRQVKSWSKFAIVNHISASHSQIRPGLRFANNSW